MHDTTTLSITCDFCIYAFSATCACCPLEEQICIYLCVLWAFLLVYFIPLIRFLAHCDTSTVLVALLYIFCLHRYCTIALIRFASARCDYCCISFSGVLRVRLNRRSGNFHRIPPAAVTVSATLSRITISCCVTPRPPRSEPFSP